MWHILMLFVNKFKGKVPKLIINDEDDVDDDDELFLWYVWPTKDV